MRFTNKQSSGLPLMRFLQPLNMHKHYSVLMAMAMALTSIGQSTALGQASSPASNTEVFFNHGESGGQEQVNNGAYTSYTDFTDPDTKDIYYGSGAASVSSNLGNNLPSLHAIADASEGGNDEGVFSQATFSDSGSFNFANSASSAQVAAFTFNFSVSGTFTGNASGQLSLTYGSDSYTY